MKSIKTRILLVLFAHLILFNSIGFGLVEHTCTMRGKKTYSFFTIETCKSCDKPINKQTGKATFRKIKCCDDKQIIFENLSESIVNLAGKYVKIGSDFTTKQFLKATSFKIDNPSAFNILPQFQTVPNYWFGIKLLHFIGLLRL